MLAGNLTAQAVSLLAAPVITRIYEPDAYGVMSLIQTLSVFVGGLICFCYHQAIVLPAKDEKAYNLSALSFFAIIFTCISLFLLVYFFSDFLSNVLKISKYKNYLYFIPIIALFLGVKDIFTYLYTRFKYFKKLSIAIAIIPLFTVLIKISAGYILTASPFWLIIANLFGIVIAVFFLAFNFRSKLLILIKYFKTSTVNEVAKEYKNFPKYSLPGTFFDSMTNNLPLLLLAFFYSPVTVGFYGFTNVVLQRPVAIISQSISQILLKKFSDTLNSGEELYNILKKATLSLFLLGIIPFSVLAFGGEFIFNIVFGDNWEEAGVYAQILAPMFFLLLINKPAGRIIIAKQKLRFGMYFSFVVNSLGILGVIAGYVFFNSPYASLTFLSAIVVFMNVIFIKYAFIISRD